jgi:hypothetical protein
MATYHTIAQRIVFPEQTPNAIFGIYSPHNESRYRNAIDTNDFAPGGYRRTRMRGGLA